MAYTGYNTRFFFRFESQAGREFRIDIKKLGYSGSAQQRPLGQTPVLKRESGDNGVHGTSLEIYAVCKTDGEFAELYTSDAREYLVELAELYPIGSGYASTVIWRGFITPELYAEPEVAPPYDVQIVATDGLGELKLYNFAASGRVSLLTHLRNILANSGLDAGATDIYVVNSLSCTTHSVSAANMLSSIYTDLDYLVGECTYYDVLVKILESLNMSITRYLDRWVLYRESDIVVSGGTIAAYDGSGAAKTLPVAEYGSMQSNTWWPVGRVDSEVVPAKNYIGVAYPFVLRDSMLTNPGLTSGDGWTYPAPSPQNPYHFVTWDYNPYVALLNNSQAGSVDIYQDITVEQFGYPSTLRVLTLNDVNNQGKTYEVQFQIRLTGEQTLYLKVKDGQCSWVTSEETNKMKLDVIQWDISSAMDTSSFNESFIYIPSFPQAGTLRVRFIAKRGIFDEQDHGFYLGGAYLLQNTVPGYKDAIVINNDARGGAGDITLTFGPSQYVPNATKNIQNLLTNAAGVPAQNWVTSRFQTEGNFLAIISKDYALGVALPRLKSKGVMNVPAGASLPFCFVNPDGIAMEMTTSEWKLLSDDLSVELLSLPAAELEVTSETITKMTKEEAAKDGGYGGGTSSAGSGSGGSGGSTSDPFFEAIENPVTGETTGAKALQDLYIIQTPANENQGTEEVTKNITDILKHLSLVEQSNTQYLVCDISLVTTEEAVAGGIEAGGGGGGGSLATLTDVTLTSLAGGQFLRYDANATHWVNVTPALTMLTDIALSSPASGQVLAYNGSKWANKTLALNDLSDVANAGATNGQALVWDSANSVWKPGTVATSVSSADADIGTSLTTIATIGGTEIKAKITHQSLSGYATESWVTQQGYITSSYLNGYATENWVSTRGYLTSVPAATDSAYGGFKTGYSESGKYYAVQLSSGKAYVYVPWTDTVYTHPTNGANKTISAANGKVLSAITVNDLGHVTSVDSKTLSTSDIPDLSGTYLPITGGTLTGDLRLKNSGTYGLSLYFGDSSYCYLQENTDDHLQVYASKGMNFLTSSTSYAITFGSNALANKTIFYGSTSECLTIYGGSSYSTNIYRNSSGLQISSATAFGGNVTVSGNVDCTGEATAGTASDRRLKDHIEPIDINLAAEVLGQLRPVTFDWNADAERLSDGKKKGPSRGFIADEYNAVIPNATRKIWGEYDAIDYEHAIPYLVGGWQQHNMRIRVLEGEIQALKEENQLMKRRLREYVK